MLHEISISTKKIRFHLYKLANLEQLTVLKFFERTLGLFSQRIFNSELTSSKSVIVGPGLLPMARVQSGLVSFCFMGLFRPEGNEVINCRWLMANKILVKLSCNASLRLALIRTSLRVRLISKYFTGLRIEIDGII